MKTSIVIESLRLLGHHGVTEQERTVGNDFIYDVRIEYPFASAAENDDLDGTVNYAVIVDIIKEVNNLPSKLLENIAWRLKNALEERISGITSGTIRVSKPNPPIPSTELLRAAAVIEW